MLSDDRVIVVCYGVGGHKEQMKRIIGKMASLVKMHNIRMVAFTDDNTPPDWFDEVIHFDEIRSKTNLMKFVNFGSVFFIGRAVFRLRKRYRDISLLSTGPGLSIFSSIIVKFFCGKVVHVETWSRFYSRSLTGRFMYLISDRFYVQNVELLKLYPKAIYAGRL